VDVASRPIYASAIGLAQWKTFGEDISLIHKTGNTFKGAMEKFKKLMKEFF
jgi:hypothetical protein